MKKTLIAMAVLAASSAAMAQSSVTLYGIVDVWAGGIKASEVVANPDRLNKVDSGGVSGSRWGVKGSEDLGGGLKAIFTLEEGFDADTGEGSGGFGRQAFVGVQGGFGAVVLGKPWTAMDDVMGASNSGFDSALSATNGVWISNVIYATNPGNAIKYTTPNFGGFSAGVSYSLDEKNGEKSDIADFSLSYGAGPVSANFAYQVQGDVVGADDLKITTLNGSYDLGMAKLLASYAQSKLSSAKATEYQIGVDVPVSSALTVSAGYAHSKRNAGAVTFIQTEYAADDSVYYGAKNAGFSLAASYSLSKRTSVYGGVSSAKGENAAGTDVSKRQLYAVGVRHAF
jgi:predicted porin